MAWGQTLFPSLSVSSQRYFSSIWFRCLSGSTEHRLLCVQLNEALCDRTNASVPKKSHSYCQIIISAPSSWQVWTEVLCLRLSVSHHARQPKNIRYYLKSISQYFQKQDDSLHMNILGWLITSAWCVFLACLQSFCQRFIYFPSDGSFQSSNSV